MQRELKFMPNIVDVQDKDVAYFIQNGTVPDVQFFLEQLSIVDNAACSWLSLLKGRCTGRKSGVGSCKHDSKKILLQISDCDISNG